LIIDQSGKLIIYQISSLVNFELRQN